MKLRDRILTLLRRNDQAPIRFDVLAEQLGLSKKEKRQLDFELTRLLGSGDVVRLPGEHYGLPGAADVVTGKLFFRQTGSAWLAVEPHPAHPELKEVFIGAEETGVALHGDRVEARLNDPRFGRRRDGDKPTGQVSRILERGSETMVGTLRRTRTGFYVAPDDPRFPRDVTVPDPAKSALKPAPAEGDKVAVKLLEWTRRHANPEGEIVERLGRTHEPSAELKAIFFKFRLPEEFPEDVRREAASLPATVATRDRVGRLDCRDVPTLTIDPDDAKDFDDALSLERLEGGDLRIGIHIADVSAYVRPGTALDREAQKRGNSTYLVGTVIPMLPEKLSNGLCSLVESQDRLTKAVFLTFSKSGRLKATTFSNTVIRSRKRLTYRQAYALLFEDDLEKIRGLPLPPKHQTGSTGRALAELENDELADLQRQVRDLWTVAGRLRRERMKGGSLDLDMPETKIFVDEAGYADRLEKIEHDESHQLIEEFMLAANEAVARETKRARLPSLYRVHDKPDDEKLQEYREFLATFGIQIGDLTNRMEVVRLIAQLKQHPQGHTLRTQLLRSLKKACYRASPDGHYGLNKPDYTHFTSPIRRYSDLVVHRVFDYYLIKHLGQEAPPGYTPAYNAARVESLGEHLSLTEQNSMEAERESVKVKLLEFFERELTKRKRTSFAAVVSDVRTHGLFVELTEAMAFGLVPVSTLPDDFYSLNNAGTALIGRRTQRTYALGQRLRVVTERVDRFKRQIDFRVVEPAPEPASAKKPGGKPARSSQR